VGAIRVCAPGSWGRSGNAIGEFGVFTQPLAAALKEHQDTCPRVPPEGHRDDVRHSAGRPQAVSPRRAGARGPNGVLGLRLTGLAAEKQLIRKRIRLARQLAHRAAHLHRTSRKDTGTVCGAPHTCPPEGHTCPVPHTCPGGRCQGVLGRDDVARSASAVPGGAGVAKLEAVGQPRVFLLGLPSVRMETVIRNRGR